MGTPLVTNAPNPPLVELPEETGKTIKLAPFFEGDTRKWFDQVEQLLSGASETIRRNSILRTISTNLFKESEADMGRSFEQIRERIITHFDDTQDQKLKKLLSQQTLGDQRPSTALRRLGELAPDTPHLVRLRFLEILPPQAAGILAYFKDAPLHELGEAADRIIAQTQPQGAAASVAAASASTSGEPDSAISRLEAQISELTKAVNAIKTEQGRRRGRSRSRGPPRFSAGRGRQFRRSPTPRRSGYNPQGPFCFYHFHFGRNANSCVSPCSWRDRRTAENGSTSMLGRPASE